MAEPARAVGPEEGEDLARRDLLRQEALIVLGRRLVVERQERSRASGRQALVALVVTGAAAGAGFGVAKLHARRRSR